MSQRFDELLHLTDAGLYCPAGEFYIDPWRPVPRALITHAHSDHARIGMGHYYAQKWTVAIMERRFLSQEAAAPSATALEYGETIALGGAEVSLHPAGHVLGSAQVRIACAGRVTVVSGDYKRDPDPTCSPWEVVPCDTFVTEATFALPVFKWRDTSEVVSEVLDWWSDNQNAGRPSLLYAYSLGKAQRLLAHLRGRAIGEVFVHQAAINICEIYEEAGIDFVSYAPIPTTTADLSQALIIAPPHLASSPWTKRFKNRSEAMASGWMRLRGQRRRRGFDKGFVMSDHADWPSILATVKESSAERIYATHGYSDTLAKHLATTGLEAHELETLYEGEME